MMFGAQIGLDVLCKMVSYLAAYFGPKINLRPPLKPVKLSKDAGNDLVEKDCVLCHGLTASLPTTARLRA